MARKRFGTLSDIRRYLGQVLNQLDSGELTEAQAKARAYISGVLAGIIRDGDIEARVLELERVIKERRP